VNTRGRFVSSCLRAIESVLLCAKFKNLITTPPSWLQSITHTHTQERCILYAQPHEHMNTEEPDDDDNNNNKNNNKYAQYAAATQ